MEGRQGSAQRGGKALAVPVGPEGQGLVDLGNGVGDDGGDVQGLGSVEAAVPLCDAELVGAGLGYLEGAPGHWG